MKTAQNTKIYRDTEVILLSLTESNFINNMNRPWRAEIYPKMIDNATCMLSHIYRAYGNEFDRYEYLCTYLGCLESLRALTRITHLRKMISHGQFNRLDEMYEGVAKQANAWKKSSKDSQCSNRSVTA